jgi:hypothetical protein
MDQMDVDQTFSTSNRSADSALPTPFFEKHLLPDDELANVNQGMRDESQYLNRLWKDTTAKDPNFACVLVLEYLQAKLKSTSMKDIVPKDTTSYLVERLNLKELQIDVRKGLEDGDWTRAIGT